MTCPECRHENRPSAKFCEACGARLAARCRACGTELRPSARFCDECGQAVVAAASEVADRLAAAPAGYTPRHLAEKILTSRSALEGERKQVTVLFADCVGFTELSRAMDPEVLHQVMDGCFQRLLDAVHRFEGTVNQFTGDGAMALFGAPIAHEDHAVRGVAAAVEIQALLREYAETLRRAHGIEFALRIGINTGPVVVGRIGDDLRMDYTAQGETVNLAARLQGAAPPGGILLSEATHRLVAGFFATRDEGQRAVKGYADPVRVFLVTGGRSRLARFDLAVERGLTPLVGRARELSTLRDGWDRVKAGQGRIVSIVGEAGTGKSRLAYEFRRSLEGETMTYVEGRAGAHTAQSPFHLVVELLEDSFGLRESDEQGARVAKLERAVRGLDPALEWTIPYLKHLLALPAEELGEGGLEEAQQKRRLAEAVRAFVLRGAQDTPVVLLAEDLQWIDPNSEELVRLLVDGIAGRPVLIVGTYRSGYAPPWRDRSFHHRLALDALTRADAERMVTSLAATADPALRDLVVDRADGNPFFIEELTRYVRERGDTRELPETVHDLLTARIDRLPEGLKRTLQIAAVLGREFRLSLLEQVACDPELEPSLAELVSRELLRQKDLLPEPIYAFSHPLVQEVAYRGLLLKFRTELHGRAGEALERIYAGRPDEALDELSEHFARSADRNRAVHYLTLAGDRAASLFAYREAQGAYARALERVPPGADGARDSVLDKLGDAAFAHGALKEALAAWQEAMALVAARGERRRLADLHRKMAGACWASGRTAPAVAHLDEGLAALGDDATNLEAARLYHERARVHFRLGQHGEATRWARRALALGQALAAPDVVSHAYNTLGVAVARDGDVEGGAEFVTRSLETALDHQLGTVACRAYTNLAVMYASLDHHRSERYCRDGVALAEKIGDRLQQAWLHCVLAGGHCTIAGDYDEGVRAAEAAVELDERLGQHNHLPVPLIILAQIHQCRGDHERSERYYTRALEVAESVGEPQLLVPCYEGLATLAIERDDEATAEAWLAKSRDIQHTTGWTSDTFLVLPFLA
ncbi:MAG TPA: adenylate/guanylate cyclase domain-containing protein [Methylomirabilota bacterium]|nr:adenylate/guanylate cyclase domain-containing protein [Methylomirabilota bacterium]